MKLKLIAFILILFVFVAGCTSADKATSTLENAGYTDVTIGGYDFLGCGQDDFSHTEFTAKNPAGKEVSGTVCCGVLKKCTIRF